MSEKLDKALADIRKQYGRESLFLLGKNEIQKVDAVSTGLVSLDNALGVGGLPRGRIIEIFGPEAGGKTTLALMVAAQVQKAGGKIGFIDAEHALDTNYARSLGVDVDSLYISQPSYGEEALEIAEALILSGDIDLVVVDSVAALVPRAELEGDMGDAQMGLQARLMSQALRKLTAVTHRSNCILLFINQVRSKIGVMFGNPETTSGGRALKFYSSVRIDLRRVSGIKKGDETIGANTKIKIVKNKCAPPYREVEAKLIYGKGFINDEK